MELKDKYTYRELLDSLDSTSNELDRLTRVAIDDNHSQSDQFVRIYTRANVGELLITRVLTINNWAIRKIKQVLDKLTRREKERLVEQEAKAMVITVAEGDDVLRAHVAKKAVASSPDALLDTDWAIIHIFNMTLPDVEKEGRK
jgi:hypothetical protein